MQIKLVKNVTTQAVVDKMNGMTSVQIEEEQVLSVPIAIDNPPEGITAHMKLQLKDKEYPEQSDNTNKYYTGARSNITSLQKVRELLEA